MAPGPLADVPEADLAPPHAVVLAPIPLSSVAGVPLEYPTWRAAAADFLAARLRGRAFARERARAQERARGEARRARQLADHLQHDLEGLEDPQTLRRRAEALLAQADVPTAGRSAVSVPDPADPAQTLAFAVDPRLDGPGNATRLFDKARRIDRARGEITARLRGARSESERLGEEERRVASAQRLSDLVPTTGRRSRKDVADPARSGPRRFLTSRGIVLLVGRGARENHELTFAIARPEDLWLHARDVPGAHVILRDPEGRAGAEDVREAAEVAAFFSDRRTEGGVDVHVARRKHLRPGRGGHGRVQIAHAETVRVHPRDPEGRLRRR
jgi:predicted ribosome quality control (RQC) complex YloA/Tae2 family protein